MVPHHSHGRLRGLGLEFVRQSLDRRAVKVYAAARRPVIPVATGAVIAAPDRSVLSLEADGSAMYTIQALWTQVRENLDVTGASPSRSKMVSMTWCETGGA